MSSPLTLLNTRGVCRHMFETLMHRRPMNTHGGGRFIVGLFVLENTFSVRAAQKNLVSPPAMEPPTSGRCLGV